MGDVCLFVCLFVRFWMVWMSELIRNWWWCRWRGWGRSDAWVMCERWLREGSYGRAEVDALRCGRWCAEATELFVAMFQPGHGGGLPGRGGAVAERGRGERARLLPSLLPNSAAQDLRLRRCERGRAAIVVGWGMACAGLSGRERGGGAGID